MDDRTAQFLIAMIALAIVGIVAFLIFLVSRFARPGGDGGPTMPGQPHWIAVLLAAVAMVLVTGLLVWQFFAGGVAAGDDWRGGDRAIVFTVVMLIAAAVGLVVFLIFVFARAAGARSGAGPAPATATAVAPAAADGTAAPAATVVAAPSAVRLLGLLILAVGYLLVNWIYLENALQLRLMGQLFYPAGFVVALVMLFDKATRSWSPKSGAESLREWLLGNAIVLLLLLGYLNLQTVADPAKYNAMFWDFLHVLLFLIAFWLLDRKQTRYRFLILYGYLILLPIDLLLWRVFLGLPVVEGVLFWSSLWPFFVLAIIFFVFEIISVIATRESNNHTVPAIKDALFVLIYAILLIAAIPPTPAA